MTKISKSASLLGTIMFQNGNTNTIHVGGNRSTGALQIWQETTYAETGKTYRSRLTGRNAVAMAGELNTALCEGVAGFVSDRNDAVLDYLRGVLAAR